jgi:hypothetical protein
MKQMVSLGEPCVLESCVMSSYAKYCQEQAAECARRAKLASSPEVAADRRNLGMRWLRLAEKARASVAPLGNASKRSAAMDARV